MKKDFKSRLKKFWKKVLKSNLLKIMKHKMKNKSLLKVLRSLNKIQNKAIKKNHK